MDERLKQLMEELNAAINDWLSESKQFPQVMAKIEADGYDVFLVLNVIKKQEEERVEHGLLTKGTVKSGLTPRDIKFLKSMHISTDK